LNALARCCDSGEPSDWYHYGRVLLHGYHCPQDIPSGLTWLRKAAEAGHEGAIAELSRHP